MKNSANIKKFLYSVLITISSLAALTVTLAFLLYKSDMGNDLVGLSAAGAAFVSTLAGSYYYGKSTGNPYSSLISAAFVLAILTFISLGTSKSEYSLPFTVPVCCAAGGVAPFFALSKSPKKSAKKIKRLKKLRRAR